MYILALLATFISLTLSSDQLVLFQSEEEFDESTKSGTWVVMFSMPWCNHCKEAEPHLHRGLQKLRELPGAGEKLFLGKVNCELTSKLCSKNGVTSYPHFKYIAKGHIREWPLGNTYDDFFYFGKKIRKTPSYFKVNTEEALEDFNLRHPIKLRLVSNDKKAIETFISLSDVWRPSKDIGFAISEPKNNENHISIIGDDPSEPEQFISSNLTDFNYLDQYITQNCFPTFAEIMISNWGQLVSGSKLIIIGAAYPEQAETPEHRLYLDTLKGLASRLKKKYHTTWVNAYTYENFLHKNFGLSTFPALFVFDGSKNIHYMFVKKDYTQGPLTENVVLEFLQRVENGQIEAEGIGSGFMGKMKYHIRSLMSTFAENPYFFAGLFGTFFCLLIGLIFLDTPGDFADESDEEEGEEKQKNKKDNKQGQSQKKTNNSKKAKKD